MEYRYGVRFGRTDVPHVVLDLLEDLRRHRLDAFGRFDTPARGQQIAVAVKDDASLESRDLPELLRNILEARVLPAPPAQQFVHQWQLAVFLLEPRLAGDLLVNLLTNARHTAQIVEAEEGTVFLPVLHDPVGHRVADSIDHTRQLLGRSLVQIQTS